MEVFDPIEAMLDRSQTIHRLSRDEFDLLVVGGGITGAGVAFDAATRGLRVAVVEKDDFGSGTSSRSSKLIHGGLRYLAHLELGLVRESLRERGILQSIAPHLVRPTQFLIPRYGKRRLLAIRVGLDVYDALALGSGFPRHRKVDADDVHRMAPALREDAAGGLVYWDARTDDTRLTWTVIRSAADHGAVAANHAEVVDLLRTGPVVTGRGPTGRVCGARIRDRETGEHHDVRARVVVNATGVWADDLRHLEDADHTHDIRPSKGIHLVFRSDAIPVDAALLLPTPDGRYVFVIPWPDDRVIVGTTDEDYDGPLDEPRARPDGIDYLFGVLRRFLTDPPTPDDLVASYAGLRPLIQKPGGSTKDLSRRHKVSVGSAGLVTITGGKLTTFRPMGAEAVDTALETGEFRDRPRSRTADVPLAGGDDPPGLLESLGARARSLGIGAEQGPRLYERYGACGSEVLDLVAAEPALAERLHPDLPSLRAEAAYAISAEGARTPDDVLSRRLRSRILSADRGLSGLDWVCDRLASAHGWNAERREREAEAYRAAVEDDLASERGS